MSASASEKTPEQKQDEMFEAIEKKMGWDPAAPGGDCTAVSIFEVRHKKDGSPDVKLLATANDRDEPGRFRRILNWIKGS